MMFIYIEREKYYSLLNVVASDGKPKPGIFVTRILDKAEFMNRK